MLLRQVLEIVDLVDCPDASGEAVARLLRSRGAADVLVRRVDGKTTADGRGRNSGLHRRIGRSAAVETAPYISEVGLRRLVGPGQSAQAGFAACGSRLQSPAMTRKKPVDRFSTITVKPLDNTPDVWYTV